jgi:hypothetical protein
MEEVMNTQKLKNIREKNIEAMLRLFNGSESNGLACPRCSAGLVDTTPTTFGMGVECGQCAFESIRLD